MRKRGRPAEDEPKNNRIMVRISDNDTNILTDLAEKTGVARSEIMRRALKMYYNLSKF